MRNAIQFVLLLSLSALCAAQARPLPGGDVQQIYQRLLPQIQKIPAFDHHAHPGFADDPDVDAMAAPPNASEALRTRDDNPELAAAAKALFGYPYNDLSPQHAKWLLDKKNELKKQLTGTAYFDSILDKINTESSVANRAMMPDYLDAEAFPMGILRRFLHVAVQQSARDWAQSRRGRLHSAAGKDAASLDAAGERQQTPDFFRRLPQLHQPHARR